MRIRHWKLRSKVIFHVAVLGILSAVILILLFINTQKNVIHALSRQKAELVGSLIKNDIFRLRKCGRIEDTQTSILEMASTAGTIKGIRILSLQGKIFASTHPGEIQSYLKSDEQELIQDMISREKRHEIMFSKREYTIKSMMLVENKAECHSCHSPENTYNGIMEVNFDYGEAASLLRKSQWKGIGLAVITVSLLTFIILRLFEKLINRPIYDLKDKMKRVQEGDLTVRLHASKDDEIGSLVKSFNIMVENLKKANSKIEHLHNQQIEKAEHLAAFGELAAGLAHEVKNPLSGMKGALEIISRETAASEPQKEIFQEILVQIDKIISVIQDFLSYARPKPLHFSFVRPDFFIENAVKLAKTQLNGKDITFDVQGLKDDAPVYLDADRMQEVILNLLLNSIAAIEDKGCVRIALTRGSQETLEIKVTDNGAGIKETHIPHLFHPFFSTKKEGTGLGLSLSKKIINTHHGSISIQSREGKGTTVLIRLPLSQPGS